MKDPRELGGLSLRCKDSDILSLLLLKFENLKNKLIYIEFLQWYEFLLLREKRD